MNRRTLPAHVYHLAEAANWPSIQKSGLLPASALLTQAGVTGSLRRQLESSQRPDHTTLPNGIQIRDQKPMTAAALKSCLIGMTPAQWYAAINARVFFWFDLQRPHRQRRACGLRPQMMLTFDAARLVEAYRKFASVTPINTGNARRKPARRGAATFVPYDLWIESAWATEAQSLGVTGRKPSHTPVELTIATAVPNAMDFVVSVQTL